MRLTDAVEIAYQNGEIIWLIEDINDSIIFKYDVDTRFAYWDSVSTEKNGRYYKRIFKPEQLERATEEWNYARERWDDSFNKLPF